MFTRFQELPLELRLMIWEMGFYHDPMVFYLYVVDRSPKIPRDVCSTFHKFVPRKTPLSLTSRESRSVAMTHCNKLKLANTASFIPSKDILVLGGALREDDKRLIGTTEIRMSSRREAGHWDAKLHELGVLQAHQIVVKRMNCIDAFATRQIGSSFTALQTVMLSAPENEERAMLNLAEGLKTKTKGGKTRGLTYTERTVQQLQEEGHLKWYISEELVRNGYATCRSWNAVDVSYLDANGFEPDKMVTPFKITRRRRLASTETEERGLIGNRTFLILFLLSEKAGLNANEAVGVLGITL
jgi:hypothetical protein